MDAAELLERLREFDLLLDSDSKFPSLAGLMARGAPAGSPGPLAKETYRAASQLRSHPDVLTIKLISGKVTFVHRPLWPAIYAIGAARESWQTRGLSKAASDLLAKAGRESEITATGDAVRELEGRLLVYAESVHSEHGFHVKHVETWQHWAGRNSLRAAGRTPAEARAQLESAVERLKLRFGAKGTLPWQNVRRPRRA